MSGTKVKKSEWIKERQKIMRAIERGYSMHTKWKCQFCERWFDGKDIYNHLKHKHLKETYAKIDPRFHYLLDINFKINNKIGK